MRKSIALFVIAALGGGLLLWRYCGKRTETQQSEVSRANAAANPESKPQTTQPALIPAQGELWVDELKEAFRQAGTNAIPSLLTLITQKQDRVTTEWIVASTGFEIIGSNAATATPALITFLNDSRPGVRAVTAKCLASIGPAATNAAPGLVAALTDPDTEVQLSAAMALAEVHGDSDLVVPALIAYLETPRDDSEPSLLDQRTALFALSCYASNCSATNLAQIKVALSRMTNAPNANIRWTAWQRLHQLDHPRRPREHPDIYRGT